MYSLLTMQEKESNMSWWGKREGGWSTGERGENTLRSGSVSGWRQGKKMRRKREKSKNEVDSGCG